MHDPNNSYVNYSYQLLFETEEILREIAHTITTEIHVLEAKLNKSISIINARNTIAE